MTQKNRKVEVCLYRGSVFLNEGHAGAIGIPSNGKSKGALRNILVTVRETLDRTKYYGEQLTDGNGFVEVIATDNLDLLHDKLSGNHPPGIEVNFCDVERQSRIKSLIVEGSSPAYFEAPTSQDVRYLMPTFPNVRSRAASTSGNRARQWVAETQSGVLVIEGPAGSGKTRALSEMLDINRTRSKVRNQRTTRALFCHSFEQDNSPRNFVDNFAMWLNRQVGIPEPLIVGREQSDPSMVLGEIERVPGMLIVLDSIDEISDTGRDRGVRDHIFGVIRQVAERNSKFDEISAVMTCRNLKTTLDLGGRSRTEVQSIR